MQKIYLLIALIIALAGCIEDGFTTSPSDQPLFSVDTLKLGTVFTDEVTTTHRFTVRNPHSKQISISEISLSGDAADYFRLNVDGISGHRFNNVEIRSKDSIYVFVEATLPEGSKPLSYFEAKVNFTTNGVTSDVVITAAGQNVNRLRAVTLTEDTHFDSAR